MNIAQGAIEAARAAGADKYASEALTAATQALQRAEDAVRQSDYRLALGSAIESRDHAQRAAKLAVEGRSKARGDAERVLALAGIRLADAQKLLATATPTAKRTTPKRVQDLSSVEKTMQEARAALARDDYATAIDMANVVSTQITQLLVEPATTPKPVAPKRSKN